MQRAQGFAQQGGETVFTAGIASTTLAQASFPLATITVYYTGTTEPAFIYSDNQQFPTPMSNPFRADVNGHWFFYAPNGRYDVMIASPELDVPWTIGDILLFDPPAGGGGDMAQTPWLSNIDGGGFNLSNVGYIDVTGGYLINGVPLANPNLWVQVPNTANIYHQGFIGVAMTNPNFAVDVVGGVNVTDNFYINGVAIDAGEANQPWMILPGSHIQYNGMVGININPSHALDVVGDVNITGQYFINGVAIGTGGTGPWMVLTGSRINYNGQVGINNANPGFALDVVGSINCTTGFFINGVPLSTGGGAGLWIPGSGGIIFYNGGNVGIGTNAPTVALQVPGIIAGGQFSMNGNPTSPVINSSGQFIGAGVATGTFGISGSYIQSNAVGGVANSGSIVAELYVEAAGGFVSTNFTGQIVINQAGAFVGAGVDVTGNGGYGIKASYIESDETPGVANAGSIVAELYLEAGGGVVITNFVGQIVINQAGAFVGAGVDVTGSGGYGVNAAYIQSTVVSGIAGSGNVTAENVIEANAGFAVSGNWNQWVINVNGAFVGAGVDVTGNGGYGVRASYIQANGNVVAAAVSGVANSGYVEAASGFVVPAFGTIINASGQWVGPPIGGGGSGIFNGPVAGTSFALVSNQANPVINTAGAFVGAGVNVGNFGIEGGNIQAGTAQAPGNVVATQYVEANNGFVVTNFSGQVVINSAGAFVGAGVSVGSYGIQGAYVTSTGNMTAQGQINATGAIATSTGYYVGSGVVINNGDQFVGVGGVNTSGSVSCSSATINGNLSVNGTYYDNGIAIINAGIFEGLGVQTTSDIFGGLFGIYGVAQGYPTQNSAPSGSASFLTGDGRTVHVLGGLIVGVI